MERLSEEERRDELGQAKLIMLDAVSLLLEMEDTEEEEGEAERGGCVLVVVESCGNWGEKKGLSWGGVVFCREGACAGVRDVFFPFSILTND